MWYCNNDSTHDFLIYMLDRTHNVITQFYVMEVQTMLSVWSNPLGSDEKHLRVVVIGRTTKWVGRMKNVHLPSQLAPKSYHFQLCPRLQYSMATLATHLHVLENLFHKAEFQMLSCLEVSQHVKTVWRKLAQECGDIVLFKTLVEQFIGWLEVILQQYGANFTVLKKLWALIEALQLEVGCQGKPLCKTGVTCNGLLNQDSVGRGIIVQAHNHIGLSPSGAAKGQGP
jgi:hypothetical protein